MVRVLMATILAAGALAVGPLGASEPDPLARHRWHDRVLVVSAPLDDPDLAEQRRLVAAAEAGFRERDLVVIEAVGPAGATLRRRLRLPDDRFRAVLIGKDGGAKLASPSPLPAGRLFGTIDAMPMRRDEMGRR